MLPELKKENTNIQIILLTGYQLGLLQYQNFKLWYNKIIFFKKTKNKYAYCTVLKYGIKEYFNTFDNPTTNQ